MRVIDDTKADLKALIRAGLGSANRLAFDDQFLNWLHYKARTVPTLPRRVLISTEVQALRSKYSAIASIQLALQVGADIQPWLGNRCAPKVQHDADMMFNHWQIVHFHLGNFFQTPSAIRRTDSLLFAHISAGEATLLDVQPHGAWTKIALLEILLQTNPTALERYEVCQGTARQWTDEEYSRLRAHGGNALIEIAGRAFMPGWGLTSSRHAMRIGRYKDWFCLMVQKLKAEFEADEVPTELKLAIYSRLGVPMRLGGCYSQGALAIIDKNRNGLVLHQMRPVE